MTQQPDYFDITIKIFQKMDGIFFSIKDNGQVISSEDIAERWEELKKEYDKYIYKKLIPKLAQNSKQI
jgi:hypothetical protein